MAQPHPALMMAANAGINVPVPNVPQTARVVNDLGGEFTQ